MRFKVVGLGGIGGALLKTLPQFLAFRNGGGWGGALIDGDRFQPRNQERQSFGRLGNKAEVMAEALNRQWGGRVEFEAVSEYLSAENSVGLIREGDVVFLCVDNHASRKLASDRCQELDDVLLVSGGNELTDGNVQVHWRRAGVDMTLPIANKFHQEIMFPEDKHPGELSCEEAAREGEPQVLITNNAIAAAMLNAFYAFLEGGLNYDEVYIDILTGNSRGVKREVV